MKERIREGLRVNQVMLRKMWSWLDDAGDRGDNFESEGFKDFGIYKCKSEPIARTPLHS